MSTLCAAVPPPRSWRGGALLSAIGLFFILTRTAVASPPQPVIHMLSNAGMAPFAVHVHALDSNLGAGSSLTARYQWDFGDPQGAYNTLEGFNAAHLYDAPGTYTVTLTVTNEEGFSAQAAASVTVSSDTRVRIHVAANGSDSNDGHSSTNPIRTFAHAMELVDE